MNFSGILWANDCRNAVQNTPEAQHDQLRLCSSRISFLHNILQLARTVAQQPHTRSCATIPTFYSCLCFLMLLLIVLSGVNPALQSDGTYLQDSQFAQRCSLTHFQCALFLSLYARCVLCVQTWNGQHASIFRLQGKWKYSEVVWAVICGELMAT